MSSTIFKVFGMTWPWMEPRSPGPLVNTLSTRPMRYISQHSILLIYQPFSWSTASLLQALKVLFCHHMLAEGLNSELSFFLYSYSTKPGDLGFLYLFMHCWGHWFMHLPKASVQSEYKQPQSEFNFNLPIPFYMPITITLPLCLYIYIYIVIRNQLSSNSRQSCLHLNLG